MTTQPSRNAPCPCGSGKRYKHCHGAATNAKHTATAGSASTQPAAATQDDPATAAFMQALQLHKAGRIDEAERIYQRLIDQGSTNPHVLHYLGVIHYQRKDYDQAEKGIRAALALDDNLAMGYNNLGLVLKEKGDAYGALACFEKAIKQDPANAPAHNNCAMVLSDLNRHAEALKSCNQAIALQPHFTEALANRGKAQLALKQYSDAAASYEQALTLAPELPYFTGQWVHSKMKACDWSQLEASWQTLLARIDTNQKASTPFPLVAIPISAEQHQRCARVYTSDHHPAHRHPVWKGEIYKHQRIRIAYLSADFHNHATAHLITQMIEAHDRHQFELIGISFGSPTKDSWRHRLEQAFDEFHEVYSYGDERIAGLVRELEIDIAVDLKGHTEGSRTGVFALRPAPVQINFLGYPGTIGADYIDYIVADPTLIPEEHRPFYDEKIVYLPHSYQVNDATKQIAERLFSRAELGLPEDAFVFCCFNDNYKITPELFDVWMRLLNRTPGSVLWLFQGSQEAADNLRAEAGKRGVDPDRLVFAPRMDLAEHLARHRLADLFLDTIYCNAHTTASDALWAGLPVLTCLGETFAGRVAASLLRAVDMPELVTENLADYESLALELASNPQRLSNIREKLAHKRLSEPLFDTERYTRHIETAYRLMVERQRAGLTPDHILVPAEPVTQEAASAEQDKAGGGRGTLAGLWKKIRKTSP